MRDDRGVGLIEVMVVMTLLTLAVGMFGLALSAMRRTADTSQDLGAVTDQARLALNELDRQIRFGYWVKNPSVSGATSSITVLTPDKAGVLRCWTWAIDGANGRLMNYVRPALPPGGSVPALPSAGSASSLWRVAAGPEGDPKDEAVIAAGSSLTAVHQVMPLNPVTYQRVLTGLYSGATATVVVAKGEGVPITLTFDMSVRNKWRGAYQASASAPSYSTLC